MFLKKKVEECLRVITPGYDPKECEHFIELIQMMYKYNSYIEEKTDTEDVRVLVEELIKKIDI